MPLPPSYKRNQVLDYELVEIEIGNFYLLIHIIKDNRYNSMNSFCEAARAWWCSFMCTNEYIELELLLLNTISAAQNLNFNCRFYCFSLAGSILQFVNLSFRTIHFTRKGFKWSFIKSYMISIPSKLFFKIRRIKFFHFKEENWWKNKLIELKFYEILDSKGESDI